MALRCLDRAADRMTMNGVHLWTQREQSAALVSGAASRALPDDWLCPSGSATLLAADGSGPNEILWMEWPQFVGYDLTATGSPKYLSIRSDVYDALVYFQPKVSAEAAGQLLRVPYFAKINRPSEVSTIYLSDPAREALLTGGLAFMLQWRYAQTPNLWLATFADFERQMFSARAASQLQQSEGTPVSFGVDDSHFPVW